jgi:non-specific serine/threonine protein kinase
MLYNLAFVAQHEGNHAEAIRILLESLALCQELGVPAEVANELLALAGSLGAVGDLVGAARLFGAADAFLQQSGALLDPNDQPEHDRNVTFVRTALGAAAFAAAWSEGQGMTLDQAVAYVRSAAGAESQPSRAVPDKNDKRSGDLTRRESEVARLIAKGLSNREIAAALVVTERTVEGHVSNILAKLGFRSRAQVTAWVVERAGQS